MTSQIRLHSITLAALLAGLVTSQTAVSQTITMTYNKSANFGYGAVGYGSGKISPNPINPGPFATTTQASGKVISAGIGGDNFKTTQTGFDFSKKGTFNTWCVDITHWLKTSGSVVYTIDPALNVLTSTFGNTRVSNLELLADEQYAGLKTKTDSAAFQLATWAIMFGSTNTNGRYELQSPTYYATSDSTGYSQAQTWLNELGGVKKSGNYKMTYLYTPDHSSQNLVTFTASAVPEPANGALLLIGLGTLAVFSRRRRH